MKNVLITGGSGVIGKELVELMLNDGNNVMNIDLHKIENHNDLIHDNYNFVCNDLSEVNSDLIKEFAPTEIYHLAASFERTEESKEHFDNNLKSNILSTHNILKVAKNLKSLNKFIFASSYLVYDPELYLNDKPNTKTKFLKENDRKSPRNLTGYSKYYNEKEIRFIFEQCTDIDFVSARIFRGYGLGSKDFISRTIDSLIKKEKLKIYNKEGAFDYLYSKDAAEGLKRLAEINFSGEVNLGAGKSRSIESVLKSLEKVFGIFDYELSLHEEVRYENSASDNSYLLSLLNWEPKYNFDKSIKEITDYLNS